MEVATLGGLRCAVSGATGFIGARLASSLQQQGAAVRGLTRGVPPTHSGIDWIVGDVRSMDAARQLVTDCDVVFHLAAQAHKRQQSPKATSHLLDVNVEGTRALVEACAQCAKPPFLILVSSVSVYGPSAEMLDESHAPAPTTAYGHSKLAAERILLAAIEQGRLQGAIVRPSAVFGDGAPGSLRWLAKALRLGFLPLVDGGSNLKSITHVDTVVDALLLLAQKRTANNGQVYIVTDDEPYPVKQLAEWLAAALHTRPRPLTLPHLPLTLLARGADLFSLTLHIPSPSLSEVLLVYSSTSVFSNRKIREQMGLSVRRPTPQSLPTVSL